MAARAIDYHLRKAIDSDGYNRLEAILGPDMGILNSFLKNASPFLRDNHLLSLQKTLELSKDQTRKNGEDVMSHYLGVAFGCLPAPSGRASSILFNGGLDHDYVEDGIEGKIREEMMGEIDKLKKLKVQRESQSADVEQLAEQRTLFGDTAETPIHSKQELDYMIKSKEAMIKNAIVGQRTSLFRAYKAEHNALLRKRGKKTQRRFLNGLFDIVDSLTRFADDDDNYGAYLLRINTPHPFAIKLYDGIYNLRTLWPSQNQWISEELSLETLAKQERELQALYNQDKPAYYEKKEELGAYYEATATKEAGVLNPQWRIRNLDKALLLINMGKIFLKSQRSGNASKRMFYENVLKPAFAEYLRQAHSQSARERMFHAVFKPEVTIDTMSEIENEWVQYMPTGLNHVTVDEPSAQNGQFEGTFQRVADNLMGDEMLRKVLGIELPEISPNELYTRALIYESTLQQHFHSAAIREGAGIVSVSDLRSMRTPEFYGQFAGSETRWDYQLKNFGDLIEYMQEHK